MSASDLPSPARVLVFAPYLEEDGALLSPHYDPPEYRAEIGSWLEAMGMDWEWVPAASRVNMRPVLRPSDRTLRRDGQFCGRSRTIRGVVRTEEAARLTRP